MEKTQKKKKLKHGIISIDMLQRDILVVLGKQEEVAPFFDKWKMDYVNLDSLELNEDDFGSIGRCIYGMFNNQHFHMIYLNVDSYDLGTVAHECFHCVDNICESIGEEDIKLGSEFRAYMMGYIFNEIVNIIGVK